MEESKQNESAVEAETETETEELPESTAELIGDRVNPSVLTDEYTNSDDIGRPGFLSGIQWLSTNYDSMRRVRGDGNCFYRAFLFAYLEQLWCGHNGTLPNGKPAQYYENERLRMLEILRSSKDIVVGQGYSEYAIECFHDSIVELFENLFTPTTTLEELLRMFRDAMESNSFTWYMRLLTASSLKLHTDKYLPFIEGVEITYGGDIGAYCTAEVEPMGRECEQVHIMAILEFLSGVEIKIQYLDGRSFEGDLPHMLLQSPTSGSEAGSADGPICVNMLYRPGHYDILYPLN